MNLQNYIYNKSNIILFIIPQQNQMSQLYEGLCDLFIRPTRQEYNMFDLGSPYILNYGKRYDFELRNPRGFKIKCSYYQPIYETVECVVYLHSLNGSRLESARFAEHFLRNKMGFANLDFSGSGKSEGHYVSLGFHEKDDALILINYICNTYKIRKFGLWGRSMGAVTAFKVAQFCSIENLNFNNNNPNGIKLQHKNHQSRQSQTQLNLHLNTESRQWKLKSILVDSPFNSLNKLAIQIAEKKVNLPGFFLKAGFILIKNSIEQRANFNLQELQLLNFINTISLPLVIYASKDDDLISFKHSEEIYSRYGGEKELIFLKGKHNEPRDEIFTDQALLFFKKHFNERERKERKIFPTMKTSLNFIKENLLINKLKQYPNEYTKSSDNLETHQSEKKLRSRTPSENPFRKADLFMSQQKKLGNINVGNNVIQQQYHHQQHQLPPLPAREQQSHDQSKIKNSNTKNSTKKVLIINSTNNKNNDIIYSTPQKDLRSEHNNIINQEKHNNSSSHPTTDHGIILDEKAHFNIISEKLNNMKKKIHMINSPFIKEEKNIREVEDIDHNKEFTMNNNNSMHNPVNEKKKKNETQLSKVSDQSKSSSHQKPQNLYNSHAYNSNGNTRSQILNCVMQKMSRNGDYNITNINNNLTHPNNNHMIHSDSKKKIPPF